MIFFFFDFLKYFFSSPNSTIIEPTELRMDPDYEFYYINWTRAIISALIPFLLLAILNGKIIWQMHKAEIIVSSRVRSYFILFLPASLNIIKS
jgi:hypothetical protein